MPGRTYSEILQEVQKQTDGMALSSRHYDPLEAARRRAANFNKTQGSITGFACPRCLNRGRLMVVHEDGSTAVQECNCMARRRSERNLERSGLAGAAKKWTFENFTVCHTWQRRAKELAERYSANPDGRWLMLSGQPGSGKTHLCSAASIALMRHGFELRYLLWRDFSTCAKQAAMEREAYQMLLEPFKRVDILYIDDFLKVGGGERPTRADLSLSFELLNNRYMDERKLTVISTEWSPKQILSFDEAVGSRILERCGKNVLVLEGADKNYRLQRPNG